MQARPQPEEGVTYAAKIDRTESRLAWDRPAPAVVRQINAFAPAPVAWAELDRVRMKILAAHACEGAGAPGTVIDDALTVACGDGAVRIDTLQQAGRQPLSASQFLLGHPVAAGAAFS